MKNNSLSKFFVTLILLPWVAGVWAGVGMGGGGPTKTPSDLTTRMGVGMGGGGPIKKWNSLSDIFSKVRKGEAVLPTSPYVIITPSQEEFRVSPRFLHDMANEVDLYFGQELIDTEKAKVLRRLLKNYYNN